MKRRNLKASFRKIFLFLPALLLVLGAVIFTTRKIFNNSVSNLELEEGTNGVGQFALTWVATGSGSIDEDNTSLLKVNPNENNVYDVYNNTSGGAQITYQMIFNMGGSEEAPPEAIQIKIPKNMFKGRDGLPIPGQVIDIPLVAYPEAAGTGFNYRFETDANDGEEYIILQNYQAIPASYAFECSITWIAPTPSDIADGYNKSISGNVTVDLDLDGDTDLESNSNTLNLEYSSHVAIDTFSESYNTHYDNYLNTYVNVYDGWADTWDERLKPENDEDYVYVTWWTNGKVSYATQPYTATVTSEATDGLSGEVIGYCNYSSAISGSSSSGYDKSCFGSSNSSKIKTDGYSYTVNKPSSTYDEFKYTYVLVKYPKSIVQDGEVHTLINTSTLTAAGVDGASDSKTATAQVDYRYLYSEPEERVEVHGFYPIITSSLSKSGNSTVYGGINVLENDKNVFVGNSKTSAYSFNIYGSGSFFPLTLDKENGNSTNPDDYGVHNWTYVMEDSVFLIGDTAAEYERLTAGDYQITSFAFWSGGYDTSDYVNKEWTTVSNNITTHHKGWTTQTTSTSDTPEMSIYCEKDNEWFLYGYVYYENGSLKFRNLDGDVYTNINSYSIIDRYVPITVDGVTGIKAVVESNKYTVHIDMTFNAELLPSDHVKSVIADMDSANVYNVASNYAIDYEDVIHSTQGGSLDNATKDTILAIDEELYGGRVAHAFTVTSYSRIKGGNTYQNKWVNFISDTANRRVEAQYTAVAYERLKYNKYIMTDEDAVDYRIIKEQRIGTFYDLLPYGVTINQDSVRVETLITKTGIYTVESPNSLSQGQNIPVSVSLVDNWQGSGRTMLIVKAVMGDDMVPNYINRTTSSVSDGYLISGMILKFTSYYSWDRIPDYGSTLTNSVAYMSGSGELSDGYPDDPSGLSSSYVDKKWFKDLNQDGNEVAIKNTVYAQRTGTFTYNTASDSSFKKGVKTANLEDYTDGKDGSVVASAGGYYTYQLRYASQKNVKTTGLIVYDVLEDFELVDVENWKGTFVDINLSQPELKGVAPVVYYSTSKSINMYANGKSTIDRPLPNDAQITNEDIWTTEMPEDKSTITAIAIDFSKDVNGNDYTLESEESLVAIITMQAPTENVDYLVEANAKALNASWWSGNTQQGAEPSHFVYSVFEWNEVGLSSSKVAIEKNSYVPSGTEDDPRLVHLSDDIVYDIIISNSSDFESFKSVGFIDDLPSGITPKMDEIAYYFEGEGSIDNTILMSTTSLLKANLDGNRVTFELSQLLSGDVIHVLLPCRVDSSSEAVIVNQAALTGFNNVPFPMISGRTFHRVGSGNVKISKKLENNNSLFDREWDVKITLIPSIDMPEEEEEVDVDGASDINNLDDDNEEPNDDVDSELNLSENVIRRLNDTYGDVTFVDGVANVKIKHGQTITISNLPEGYEFLVEEVDYTAEGFATAYKHLCYSDETAKELDCASAGVVNPNNVIARGTIVNLVTSEIGITNTDVNDISNTNILNPETLSGLHKFVILLMASLGTIFFLQIRKKKINKYNV